jgi:hypothetical protein
MGTYETHIGEVSNSAFVVGEKGKAEVNFGRPDRDDIAEPLRVLIGIVSKYAHPVADEVLELAVAARREMGAEKPEKQVFQRLTEATRKMIDKLGASLVEAGALADAVTRISDAIHHL